MANLVYLLLVLTLPLNPKQSSREAIPGTSLWGFFCHRRNVLYGQDFSCRRGVSFACQAVWVHVRYTSVRPAAVKMWAAALFQYAQIHCWAPAPSCWPISNPLKTGRLVTTVFFWLNLLFLRGFLTHCGVGAARGAVAMQGQAPVLLRGLLWRLLVAGIKGNCSHLIFTPWSCGSTQHTLW